LEAILLLIERAQHLDVVFTQYDIVKSLFIADTFHLSRYGRPITYDNYSAMEHGPVPSLAYDMLKPGYDGHRFFEKWPLWERRHFKGYAYQYASAKRSADLSKLSESDVSCLHEAQDVVVSFGFHKTRDYTHKHPAYKAAWKPESGRKAFPMDYRLLIEGQDAELLEEIALASRRH